MEHVYTEQTEEMKSKAVVITLKPPLELVNQLPYTLNITLDVSIMVVLCQNPLLERNAALSISMASLIHVHTFGNFERQSCNFHSSRSLYNT